MVVEFVAVNPVIVARVEVKESMTPVVNLPTEEKKEVEVAPTNTALSA